MRNLRKGGLLFLAPPCGLWVFLTLGSIQCWSFWWKESLSCAPTYLFQNCIKTTYAKFWSAAQVTRNDKKVMVGSRRGYLLSRGPSLEHLCDAYVVSDTWMNYCTMVWFMLHAYFSEVQWPGYSRIFYAHLRGVHFVIEQPMTSVRASLLWCYVTVTIQEQKWANYVNRMPPMFLEVMFLWIPVARLLRFCKARSGFWLVCPMVSRCKLIAKDYMIESANHGCIYCLKGQPCAGEFVSQWLLMGQAPWNKPCHSVEHIFCLTCELPIKNKHDQPIMLKGSLCHSSEALGNTSTPWQPPPLYQRKAPHGCFGEDRVDVRLLFVGCTQSVSGRILIYPVARIQHSKPKLVNKTISKDGRVRVVSFLHYMSTSQNRKKATFKGIISSAYGQAIWS